MQNFASKVPEIPWPQDKVGDYSHKGCFKLGCERQLSFEFMQKYEGKFPSLVKAFQKDLYGLLNHLKPPPRHSRYVRTTNLIERRRTKIILGFMTENKA